MPERLFSFKQSLQLFFVRKILADRHTFGSLVGRALGDRFFGAWSKIIRDHESDDKFPRFLRIPSDFAERKIEGPSREEGAPPRPEKPGRERGGDEGPDLSFAPQAYHGLLGDPAFSGLVKLLGDSDLGELMRIEYPKDTSAIAVATGAVSEGLIREAIARHLHKKVEKLPHFDLSEVPGLDLSGLEVTDLEPLKGLTSLRALNLGNTSVTDLEPLSGLTSLAYLSLRGTQVTDLEPLRGLKNLERVALTNTKVSDEQVAALQKALPDLHIVR